MVDPLEAKRLAAVEWKLLQEREAFQVSLPTPQRCILMESILY